MPGGFIGVDVFFVISGFLITGIITRELERGRFSLIEFYNRRIRRIFPALIVVLSATLALGWFWMLPQAFAQLGSDSFASAAFLANIALLLQSGYFDVESARKPLLHLWSLGIEEQFYLFWPLLLMLAARFRIASWRWPRCSASPPSCSTWRGSAQIRSRPSICRSRARSNCWPARCWPAAGSASIQSSAASNRRGWIGVALIAVAAVMLDSHRAFPGWWAVLPVAGSALLLSAPAAWVNRVVLASPPMVWIGLISYPLYLWHWPLLVFGEIDQVRPADAAGARIDTCSRARCWPGRPIGSSRYRSVSAFRAGARCSALGAGMAMVAVAGFAVVWGGGFEFRLPPEIRAMASVRTESSKWRFHECLLDLGRETNFADACVERDRRPLVLIWGDSTAGALLPGLRKAQETRNFGIAQLTSSSCIPALECRHCGRAELPRDERQGFRARSDRSSLTSCCCTEPGRNISTTSRETVGRAEEGDQCARRRSRRRAVVAARSSVGSAELFPASSRADPGAFAQCEPPTAYDAVMRARLEPLGAEFISASDALCNAQGCLTRIGDAAADLTASDQVHLTEKGSVYLIEAIIDRVLGGEASAEAPR